MKIEVYLSTATTIKKTLNESTERGTTAHYALIYLKPQKELRYALPISVVVKEGGHRMGNECYLNFRELQGAALVAQLKDALLSGLHRVCMGVVLLASEIQAVR